MIRDWVVLCVQSFLVCYWILWDDSVYLRRRCGFAYSRSSMFNIWCGHGVCWVPLWDRNSWDFRKFATKAEKNVHTLERVLPVYFIRAGIWDMSARSLKFDWRGSAFIFTCLLVATSWSAVIWTKRIHAMADIWSLTHYIRWTPPGAGAVVGSEFSISCAIILI